jgi:hypothetical protein
MRQLDFPKYARAIKSVVGRFWFDLLLGLGVLLSIYGFIRTRGNLDEEGGFNNLVATLAAGDAQRRPRGSMDFASAPVGTDFMNLDSIWVEKNQTALLQTGDGYVLELEPQTLLVLRIPFKARSAIEDRYRIIIGKVRVRRHSSASISTSANRFSEQPKEMDKPVDKLGGGDLRPYPVPGSKVFVDGPGVREFPVTWGKPANGFLVLSRLDAEAVLYFPLTDQSFLRVRAEANHPYLWQIVNPAKQVILGPYRFELASGGTGTWKNILDDASKKGNHGKFDVLIDSKKPGN